MSEREQPYTPYGMSPETWGDVSEGSAERRFLEVRETNPDVDEQEIASRFGLTAEEVAALNQSKTEY
jgi:hypothetical protein